MSFAARAGNVLPWALLGALVIAGAAVPAVAPVRAPEAPLGVHVPDDGSPHIGNLPAGLGRRR